MPYNTGRSATFNPRNLVTSDVPHVIVVHSSAFYDRRRPSAVCPRWPCEAERHRRIQAATKFPSAQGEKRERRSGAALQRRSGAAEHRRTGAAAQRRASASAGHLFKYTHTQVHKLITPNPKTTTPTSHYNPSLWQISVPFTTRRSKTQEPRPLYHLQSCGQSAVRDKTHYSTVSD